MSPARRFTIPAASAAEPSSLTARRVHVRDRFTCVYFGARRVGLEVDHVRPKAHFAATTAAAVVNAPHNLATACADCNAAKGPQNLDGFAAMLRGRDIPAAIVAAMRRRVRAALRRRLPLSIVP